MLGIFTVIGCVITLWVTLPNLGWEKKDFETGTKIYARRMIRGKWNLGKSCVDPRRLLCHLINGSSSLFHLKKNTKTLVSACRSLTRPMIHKFFLATRRGGSGSYVSAIRARNMLETPAILCSTTRQFSAITPDESSWEKVEWNAPLQSRPRYVTGRIIPPSSIFLEGKAQVSALTIDSGWKSMTIFFIRQTYFSSAPIAMAFFLSDQIFRPQNAFVLIICNNFYPKNYTDAS